MDFSLSVSGEVELGFSADLELALGISDEAFFTVFLISNSLPISSEC
jgi:hypothetical protein